MRYLVTGAAGFIGYHVSERLLARGDEVVGLDNLNPYYDPALKEARLSRLQGRPGFRFLRLDLADRGGMETCFAATRFDRVIHLAAQAGVRHSLTDPHAYAAGNLTGFLHVLEGCRHQGVGHLIFASSSSVYGLNGALPFSPHHGTQHPVSLYAATKQANEAMAHAYAHLYRLPCTGLRYFTVYGPWARPDMALFTWTRAILAGRPVEVYNFGGMRRDFTYVDDIADGTIAASDRVAAPEPAWDAGHPDPASSSAPFRLYNLGCGRAVDLMEFLEAIEAAVGRPAQRVFLPMQAGDVPVTAADIADLARDVGFVPRTQVADGVRQFVEWYRGYYRV
jgi:UDP-glucuronate 4-epimerase